jgi:muramoyltetrapeptide carboxypeptidase
MLKPRALRSGDRIAVVAPASPFDRAEFEAGIVELRGLGFEPVYHESVFQRRGFVAGDASVRADAFMTSWRDPSIAGLIGARGGYGSVQMLPWLDATALRIHPKPFIGYSDLTSILIYLTSVCRLVAFHGPMLAGRLGRGARGYDRDTLLRVVGRAEAAGEITGGELETLRTGESAGPLLGGTLTQVVASLGTPFAFDPPAGYVLFVDEVRERPYRLDRMLTQMRLSGLLERASGVVFGELPGCDEPDGQVTARAVVADCLRDFSGPVLFGLPSGHTTRPAVTLPFGVMARIVATPQPRLIIEEAAVA